MRWGSGMSPKLEGLPLALRTCACKLGNAGRDFVVRGTIFCFNRFDGSRAYCKRGVDGEMCLLEATRRSDEKLGL